MLVKNNEARIHRIGAGVDHAEITLLPGVNDVPDRDWSKAKEIKLVGLQLKAKTFEEVGSSKESPGAGEQKSPKDMKVDDAVKLIGETYDRELLKRWALEDERKGVQKAIADQQELIEANSDEDAGDDTGDQA